jgi:hypothetical protein
MGVGAAERSLEPAERGLDSAADWCSARATAPDAKRPKGLAPARGRPDSCAPRKLQRDRRTRSNRLATTTATTRASVPARSPVNRMVPAPARASAAIPAGKPNHNLAPTILGIRTTIEELSAAKAKKTMARASNIFPSGHRRQLTVNTNGRRRGPRVLIVRLSNHGARG